VRLYPIFHPAAALYTPSMLTVLEQDFARLPVLLGAPAAPEPERVSTPPAEGVPADAVQLGLF
jgi:DNA polymerase